jgi:hypothetical protein
MKAPCRFALAVCAVLLLPGLVHGQDGLTVKLVPRAGLAAPDRYFYEVFTNFAGDGPVEWTTGSLGRAFVAGLGVQVGFGGDGVLVRGEILRSFDTWLQATHSIVQPRVLFEPPRIVNTFLDVPMTFTFTSLQVVLPMRLELWRAKPYVLLGVGGKRYGFGESTRPNEAGAVLPSNGFTWGGDLGGGFTFEAFGVTADVQFRDAITRYWGKTQHDLLFTGGLLWRLW